MDLTSIVGIVLGMILVIQGILQSGELSNFFDPPSIVIVLGGTVASVIASYPFKILKRIPKHMKILVQGKRFKEEEVIEQLVEFSQIARRDGILALEERANEIKDPFLKQSIMLVVDAIEEDKVREILESQMEDLEQRHEEAAGIYEKASQFAPAFGMIGTLVGLINMLAVMDPEKGAGDIGANMSVALVTTFYGCMLANVIFLPIAKKLRVRNDEEIRYCEIILDGILSIQSGDNPKFLKEKLISHLSKERQKRFLKNEEKKGSQAAAE